MSWYFIGARVYSWEYGFGRVERWLGNSEVLLVNFDNGTDVAYLRGQVVGPDALLFGCSDQLVLDVD